MTQETHTKSLYVWEAINSADAALVAMDRAILAVMARKAQTHRQSLEYAHLFSYSAELENLRAELLAATRELGQQYGHPRFTRDEEVSQ